MILVSVSVSVLLLELLFVCAVGACDICLVIEVVTAAKMVIGVVIGVFIGVGVNDVGLVFYGEDAG